MESRQNKYNVKIWDLGSTFGRYFCGCIYVCKVNRFGSRAKLFARSEKISFMVLGQNLMKLNNEIQLDLRQKIQFQQAVDVVKVCNLMKGSAKKLMDGSNSAQESAWLFKKTEVLQML